MKIKILKDIPGYKAGEILEGDFIISSLSVLKTMSEKYEYNLFTLIKDGYAEEIKDIDIEAIRKSFKPMWQTHDLIPNTTIEEILFFTAYRIVKAVIDQLNGDWKPVYEIEMEKYYIIGYDHDLKMLQWDQDSINQYTILPPCRDSECANRVMELCESELLILFNIDNKV